MRRRAFTSAALLCCLALSTAAFAQAAKPAPASTTPPPVSEDVLKARMKPPVKGVATIDIIQTPSKLVGKELVGQIKIKNTSDGPIVGLKLDQYFYNGQQEVSACTSRVRNAIAAGEIVDVTLSCPSAAKITGSNLMFTHANGQIKPTAVKSFDAAKKPAAAPKKGK